MWSEAVMPRCLAVFVGVACPAAVPCPAAAAPSALLRVAPRGCGLLAACWVVQAAHAGLAVPCCVLLRVLLCRLF